MNVILLDSCCTLLANSLSREKRQVQVLTVSLTSRGVVAFQNTNKPSFINMFVATEIILPLWLPILCILVLMLSNGIDAYLYIIRLHTIIADAKHLHCHDATASSCDYSRCRATHLFWQRFFQLIFECAERREPHSAVCTLLTQYWRETPP